MTRKPKYEPKMGDLVVVAAAYAKGNKVWLGATGKVCGLMDGRTVIDLDEERFGQGILQAWDDSFRLERRE